MNRVLDDSTRRESSRVEWDFLKIHVESSRAESAFF
jgi:hypothetical protein